MKMNFKGTTAADAAATTTTTQASEQKRKWQTYTFIPLKYVILVTTLLISVHSYYPNLILYPLYYFVEMYEINKL